MFPRKIIGRYVGTEQSGVKIEHLLFKPHHNIECVVSEDIYNQIIELCNQATFELFEFASTQDINNIKSEVSDVKVELNNISEQITPIKSDINDLKETIASITNNISDIKIELSNTNSEVSEILNSINIISNNVSAAINVLKDVEASQKEQMSLIEERLSVLEHILSQPTKWYNLAWRW